MSEGKKKQPEVRLFSYRKQGLLGCCFSVFVTESFNASTHGIHRFLSSRVKGVWLAGSVKLVQRQFTTIVHFDGFFGVRAGAGHKFEAIGKIDKANFSVLGVYSLFHKYSLCRYGSHTGQSDALFAKEVDSSLDCLPAPTHHVKEVNIRLGGFHIFEHQFHRFNFI